MPFAEIKGRAEVMQFFGEKYGDQVRVVQIGGQPGSFDGYSMELCGGTHTRATGEIGLFRIASESAIAAGVRRIEAVAGLCAYQKTRQEAELLGTIAAKINSPAAEVEKKLENLLAQQKELEKQLRAMRQKQAAETARDLAAQAQTIGHFTAIVQNLGEVEGDFLQMVIEALRRPIQRRGRFGRLGQRRRRARGQRVARVHQTNPGRQDHPGHRPVGRRQRRRQTGFRPRRRQGPEPAR